MRILVIGLGSIGIRHAKNLMNDGHKVLGIDPDESRTDLLLSHGGTAVSNTHCDADAWVIATPTERHAHYLIEAAKRGKDVFVEKPICSLSEAAFTRLAVEELFEKDKLCMVGNMLRFHSVVRQIKVWLNDKHIGMPQWASITIGQKNNRYVENVLTNWGAHEIDLAIHWFGGHSRLLFAAQTASDHAHLGILHLNGIASYINLDYLTDPCLRQGFIVGTHGLIEYDLQARTAKLWAGEHRETPFLVHGIDSPRSDRSIASSGSYDQDYIEEIRKFIDLISGHYGTVHTRSMAPVAIATGHDALEVIRICKKARDRII